MRFQEQQSFLQQNAFLALLYLWELSNRIIFEWETVIAYRLQWMKQLGRGRSCPGSKLFDLRVSLLELLLLNRENEPFQNVLQKSEFFVFRLLILCEP